MRKNFSPFAAAAVIALGLVAGQAQAQSNTSAAGMTTYEVGQGWVSHFFDETATARYFSFGENGGRSYCIEAVQGSVSPMQLDPNIAVYTDTTAATALTVAGTPLTNNDGLKDPYYIKGARACYIAQAAMGASAVRSFKVNVPVGAGSGVSGFVKVRVVDTSLFSPVYGANYNGSAFIASSCMAVANATNATVNFKATLTYFVGSTPTYSANSASIVAGGLSGPCVGWAQPTGVVYGVGLNGTGTLIFAHDGPPGAIRGQTRYIDVNYDSNSVTSILQSK